MTASNSEFGQRGIRYSMAATEGKVTPQGAPEAKADRAQGREHRLSRRHLSPCLCRTISETPCLPRIRRQVKCCSLENRWGRSELTGGSAAISRRTKPAL